MTKEPLSGTVRPKVMRRRIGLFVLTAFVVAACGTERGSEGIGRLAADQGGVVANWLLDSGTHDDEDVPILDDHPISLTFDGARLTGVAACNSYGGEYEIDNRGNFTVASPGIHVTEMACFPEEAMESETKFLSALVNVDSVVITESAMILSGGGSELRFTLDESQPPPAPADPSQDPDEPTSSDSLFPREVHGGWILISGELDGNAIPILDDYPVKLFLGHETIGGAVCNTFGYSDPFPDDGSFPEIFSTLMSCGPEADAAEGAFLEALRRYEDAQIVNGQLVIRGEGVMLTFDVDENSPYARDPDPRETDEPVESDEPAEGVAPHPGEGLGSDPSLFLPGGAQGEWVLVAGQLNDEPLPIVESHPIRLVVSGDEFGGTVCNSYGVTMGSDGTPSDVIQTMMSCGEEVDQSERAYFDALVDTASAGMVGDQLFLRGVNAHLTFERP